MNLHLYKYRSFISQLFLCIYFIVAMPVSLWHCHIYETKADTKTEQVSVSDKKVTEIECSICQQHYPDYIAEWKIADTSTTYLTAEKYTVFNQQLNGTDLYFLSNKSPPFIS